LQDVDWGKVFESLIQRLLDATSYDMRVLSLAGLTQFLCVAPDSALAPRLALSLEAYLKQKDLSVARSVDLETELMYFGFLLGVAICCDKQPFAQAFGPLFNISSEYVNLKFVIDSVRNLQSIIQSQTGIHCPSLAAKAAAISQQLEKHWVLVGDSF